MAHVGKHEKNIKLAVLAYQTGNVNWCNFLEGILATGIKSAPSVHFLIQLPFEIFS